MRMLTDFVDLEAGDAVIQNGANSAVGRAVIQIAKARGEFIGTTATLTVNISDQSVDSGR